jgi:hypothetical protein
MEEQEASMIEQDAAGCEAEGTAPAKLANVPTTPGARNKVCLSCAYQAFQHYEAEIREIGARAASQVWQIWQRPPRISTQSRNTEGLSDIF